MVYSIGKDKYIGIVDSAVSNGWEMCYLMGLFEREGKIRIEYDTVSNRPDLFAVRSIQEGWKDKFEWQIVSFLKVQKCYDC